MSSGEERKVMGEKKKFVVCARARERETESPCGRSCVVMAVCGGRGTEHMRDSERQASLSA